MFTKRNSVRHLLDICLEINLSSLGSWLQQDTDIVPPLERSKWDHPTVLRYRIVVIPTGKDEFYCYHESVNRFSESLAGIRYLDQRNETDPHWLEVLHERYGAEELEWGTWRGCLGVHINRRSIMLAPIDEAIPLMNTGQTSHKGMDSLSETVDIPIAFDNNDVARKHIAIHRHINDRMVVYSNQLVAVSFNVPDRRVEY